MIHTGLKKKIDELGRIVIPKSLRKELGLTEKTQVEFYTIKKQNKKFLLIAVEDGDTTEEEAKAEEIVNSLKSLGVHLSQSQALQLLHNTK